MIELLSALLGAITGGVLSYYGQKNFEKVKNEERQYYYCRLLYNDLESIKYYLEHERSFVNIRYCSEWQQIVAECGKLTDEMIIYIYNIYDNVYNYNYKWKQKVGTSFGREDISEYNKLQELFFSNEKGRIDFKKSSKKYEELLDIIDAKNKEKRR